MHEYKKGSDVRIMTRDQVRGFDSFAINTLGIVGVMLMENAGRSCAELVMKELDSRLRGNDKKQQPEVVIICGAG
ncbi:MAG: hypothetical protein PHF37_08350, partial [Phycisphaerae bacterium]|nr:hypothetical protein [Phycisphaerae bacterium]